MNIKSTPLVEIYAIFIELKNTKLTKHPVLIH